MYQILIFLKSLKILRSNGDDGSISSWHDCRESLPLNETYIVKSSVTRSANKITPRVSSTLRPRMPTV